MPFLICYTLFSGRNSFSYNMVKFMLQVNSQLLQVANFLKREGGTEARRRRATTHGKDPL